MFTSTISEEIFTITCTAYCNAVQPIRARYSNEFTASIGLSPLRAVHHLAPPQKRGSKTSYYTTYVIA